ncbi:helix-turn-helix transcriptional regulator [Thalassobaculum sp.]|uniref:PadR family transcriptional regulator n=1 Tax=Thalassobaculum sp. TaxID=2022740 RepID=UPI0032ECB00A
MNVAALCLGVLSFGDTSGYGIRRAVEEWFQHFGQASLGAIYPALAKLTARGAIEVIGAPDAPLEKRDFRITEIGRAELAAAAMATDGGETIRSPFLAGMFFAHLLEMDDVRRLMSERLAGLRGEQRRLRGLPADSMTEGQRFTIRYSLTVLAAAIDFLEHEGQAIVTSIDRSTRVRDQ